MSAGAEGYCRMEIIVEVVAAHSFDWTVYLWRGLSFLADWCFLAWLSDCVPLSPPWHWCSWLHFRPLMLQTLALVWQQTRIAQSPYLNKPFLQVETCPLVDEDVSLSLYSFVKQLSHFKDFLDYCFEFQFAILATIGWPFLFLAHIDTAVRLEIFSEISFPCGIGNNCSCIYLSGNSTDFTIL